MAISDPGLLVQILDASPDGLLTVNQQGVIVHANMQMLKLSGYARAEVVGKSIELLLPERMREIHVTHREQYFRAPEVQPMGLMGERRMRRKDGSEIFVEVTLAPVKLERSSFTTATVRDVTERKSPS